MSEEILKFAKCCGNCVHCNQPRKADGHEAHYMVAKTQRWCHLNNFRTTREAVCDNFELFEKKGGVPAIKRIFSFHRRAERIKKIANMMDNKTYKIGCYYFKKNNSWITYCFKEEFSSIIYNMRDDEGYMDRYLDDLEKELEEK